MEDVRRREGKRAMGRGREGERERESQSQSNDQVTLYENTTTLY